MDVKHIYKYSILVLEVLWRVIITMAAVKYIVDTSIGINLGVRIILSIVCIWAIVYPILCYLIRED